MSLRSMETPPNGALTLPSSDVPVAERNDRHFPASADANDLLNVLGRLRIHDGIGRLTCDPGRGVPVLLSDGL